MSFLSSGHVLLLNKQPCVLLHNNVSCYFMSKLVCKFSEQEFYRSNASSPPQHLGEAQRMWEEKTNGGTDALSNYPRLIRITSSISSIQNHKVLEPEREPCTPKVHPVGASPAFTASFGKKPLETFLGVQWLRLCAPDAGAWVQSLVRELDPNAATKDLICHN